MDEVECVVIGAGVVGLAIARRLAEGGREVLLLEAAEAIGTGTSARNSEVIHAGLYYPRGSLKATLCVRGRQLLYDYCAARGIAHRRCGKLVVATGPARLDELQALLRRAHENGVADVASLTGAEARALEPALSPTCTGALLSPSTGIVDSHQLMLALQGDAEAAGAVCALRSPVDAIDADGHGFVVQVGSAGDMPLAQVDSAATQAGFAVRASCVVNSAGLYAGQVARRTRGLAARHVPRLYLARGNYFSVSARAQFERLIYPLPDDGGLGVHLTLDLGGQAKFGPDVEWVEAIGYDVDPHRAERFYAAIRQYWPALADGALQPAYAGIRPKLSGPGAPAADFMVQGPAEHGMPGLVNLFGIESPGLTASLALAEHVGTLLGVPV
jgi:L-2-hydroxyglutarate oxidase LhgO